MDTYFGAKPPVPRLLDLVRDREISESKARVLVQKTNVTEDLVSRLGLEKELEGHQGCVNCLQWGDSGEVLASASDDMHIFLWNPFTYKKLCCFSTGHIGNIFSVKFIPKSNNNIVVSGSADAMVKVSNLSLSEVLFTCSCHTDRVKRIATAESVPFLFWSAAEDGCVMQHDLRTPHRCMTGRKSVLVDLANHVGRNIEAKCMAVSEARPELVAVGANDPYIRMYDRRMIKLGQVAVSNRPVVQTDRPHAEHTRRSAKGDPEDNVPLNCAQYFIAGHLRSQHRDNVRSFAATYVTFSGDGTELLVNMGGEHIYLFDIMKQRQNKLFDIPTARAFGKYKDDENDQLLLSSAYGTDPKDTKKYVTMNQKILPDHVEDIKKEANNKFQLDNYIVATKLYNKALGYCPKAAVLYGNRAAAFMKRRWDGDVYAALRDCQTTLLLDPEHVKAHFRLARCLFDLDCPYEANRVIEDFEENFPDYAANSARRALKQDITERINHGTRNRYEYVETLSPHEQSWRSTTSDYKLRYCGHCNTTTDIKEANFFGNDGQYIVAGSDDGNIFIWDRHTTNIVRILRGDAKIVNCLQPHPSSCLLATSGIDSVIRLWSPLPEDDKLNERELKNHEDVAVANQIRMNSDPFDLMMMNMGYGFSRRTVPFDDEADEQQRDPVTLRASSCRPS